LGHIKWWELRRIPYTIAVASVGFASFFVSNSIIELYAKTADEFLNPASVLIGVPLAVVVANICYTFGWIVEITRKKIIEKESRRFRTIAFYSGPAFSVLLMSAPVWVALLHWSRMP
jgi:hypothetical protein